jgi:oligo-1,6-glucosidase
MCNGGLDVKAPWWKESVVYQIYPRSFKDSNGDGIGDLNGITEKLDYLQLLGVDVIWLSPVYDSPNDDNGYDIRDYQAIMEEFGTLDDWKRMLNEMHARGIKLMMDLVVNHSSDEHAWFVEARKSKDNPYRDYYIWRPARDGGLPNNWDASFGGKAWEFDEATGEYYLHLFSKKQPDLNWENPAMREEVYKMMRWWLDLGVDGFRMDVINMISKQLDDPTLPFSSVFSGPKVGEYLSEMNREVLSKYDTITVGEAPCATVEDAMEYANLDGSQLNMIFQFEHVDLDSGPNGKWDLRPLTLSSIKASFTKWQTKLYGKAWNSLYWNNHDQPRTVSRFGIDREDLREKSAKMLGTVLHFMQGTPYIYQGEELGMTNVRFDSIDEYKDIETLNMYRDYKAMGKSHDEIMAPIYYKGRDNARTPMHWDASPHAGFTTGEPWIKLNPNYTTINAEAAIKDENSVFHYYRKLIQLRKRMPVIIEGEYALLLAEHDEIYAYTRTYGNDKLLIMANMSGDEAAFESPVELTGRQATLVISNIACDADWTIQNLVLSPQEVRVYQLT